MEGAMAPISATLSQGPIWAGPCCRCSSARTPATSTRARAAFARDFYAISTAVICRGDNGQRQPAFASVLGDLSAGAISNLYYAPSDRQGAALTFENGFLGVAGDAMNNVFQEFFLRKFTPKSAKTP